MHGGGQVLVSVACPCHDTKSFFEQAGSGMQAYREGCNCLNSRVINNLGFVLYARETEVSFCWQVKIGGFPKNGRFAPLL
jgi:hypothetical protein